MLLFCGYVFGFISVKFVVGFCVFLFWVYFIYVDFVICCCLEGIGEWVVCCFCGDDGWVLGFFCVVILSCVFSFVYCGFD